MVVAVQLEEVGLVFVVAEVVLPVDLAEVALLLYIKTCVSLFVHFAMETGEYNLIFVEEIRSGKKIQSL